MEHEYIVRVLQLLDEATALKSVMLAYLDEAITLLRRQAEAAEARPTHGGCGITPPVIDQATFTIHWQNAHCDLHSMIPLQLMVRLCRRPDHYIGIESLLDDVWQGARRSPQTIRSTVRRLKRQLEKAGMADLANRIRCRSGRYALVLHDRE